MGAPLKWRARVVLDRLGLWNGLEIARLLVRYLARVPHEADYALFSKFGRDSGLFLDIGANIGQSAVSFRIFNRSFKIVSFEPNPRLSKGLRRLKPFLGRRFDFQAQGIGEDRRTLPIFWPVVQGCALTQEGSLFREKLLADELVKARVQETTGQRGFELAEAELSIVPLDDFEFNPDLIKLDVQGAELAALKGMVKTLTRARPILMIENGSDMPTLAKFLKTLGYERGFVYDSAAGRLTPTETPSTRLNLFFIHNERVAWARTMQLL